MSRHSIKVVGASGQGINTLGEILALALKRAGFYTFGYREYPSLIKGGYGKATYQLDFSNQPLFSSNRQVDLVLILNKQSTDWKINEVKKGGIICHDISNPRINNDEKVAIQDNSLSMVYVPAEALAKAVGGNELVSNIVSIGNIWQLLGLDISFIEQAVREKFASKPQFIELDLACVREGYNYDFSQEIDFPKRLLKPNEISETEKLKLHANDLEKLKKHFTLATERADLKENLLISGNESLAIGAVNAGVRVHYSYPMTPSSSILTYLAATADKTGMIVKQVEDEITAAAMTIGSMYMGTRALTATSGGGFDLMTEHMTLAAITEIPFVCILAQRPGPATGLPTWTAQGDLNLAIFSGHGEYARCVISVGDAEDAFYLIQEAFNIAEEYQIPVLVLTEKQIAESYYTIPNFDPGKVKIKRGLVTKQSELENLVSTDRYKFTDTGISPRWIPGSSVADYNSNSDEHDEEGNVTEEAEMARKMMDKRIRKQDLLLKKLPEPQLLYNNTDLASAKGKLRFIGWGSTLGTMKDVMKYYEGENVKVDYLHVKYLWPLKTEVIKDYLSSEGQTIIVEGNHTGQLQQLIKMQTGMDIPHRLNKWDGRPFFLEDIIDYVNQNRLIQN